MKQLVDEDKCDLILTTGGTGCSPRDVTPEATKEIIDREVPGIAEAIRAYSLTITKRAMLGRGIAGIRKKTLIINLPGSQKAVSESLTYIMDTLEHGLAVLKGDTGDCGRS
jgi:molybdenum cofactor synthesis domain-containing protein